MTPEEREAKERHEYHAWLERDARAAERQARRGRGSLSYEERPTCEWCGSFVVHSRSTCRACGHEPDHVNGHSNVPNRRKKRRNA